MAVGISRSLVGDPTLLRAPEWKDRGARHHLRNRDGMLSAGLLAGAVIALALFVGSFWMPHELRAIMAAMACAIPGLVLFDATRYWYFANAHTKLAAFMDLAWLLLQMTFFGVLFLLDSANATALVLAWAGAGVVTVLAVAVSARYRFSILGGVWWLKRNKDLSWNFLAEYATLSGVQQGVTFLTAAFSGLASVGSIRAAQTILGPINVITGSASVIVLPQSRVHLAKDPGKLPWFSLRVSATLAMIIAFAWGVVALLPEQIGRELLGVSWVAGQQIAMILGISLALNSISYGATSGLRAMEEGRVSLRIRLITAPIALLMVGTGAAIGDAEGAILGLVFASAIQSVAWWIVYLCMWKKLLRRPDDEPN